MKRKVQYIFGVLCFLAVCMIAGILFLARMRDEQAQREQQAAKELQMYTEFLEGSRSVDEWMITDLATVTGEPKKKETVEYTMFDCDGDKLPELHVRTVKDYYIIDCNGEELYAWKYLYPQTEILNNGDFLYTYIGGAPLHYDYKYFSVDSHGEDDEVIRFSCYDDNGDGVFDEKDLYLGDDAEEISYKQWLKWKKKYLGVGTDEVIWKEINISAVKPPEVDKDVISDQYADVENRYEELLQGTNCANWQDEPVFCFGDVIYIKNIGYQFAGEKYIQNGERLTDYLPEEDREYLSGLLENNCLGTVLQCGNRLIYGRKQTTDDYRITIVEYPTGDVLKTCVLSGKVECVYGDRLYYQAERMNAEGEKRYHIEYLDISDGTSQVVYVSDEYPGQMMVREDGALAFATYSDGYFIATADNTLRKLHEAINDKCWYAAEMFKRFDETGLYFGIEYLNHDVELIRLCEDGKVYSRKSIAEYGEVPLTDGVLYCKGTEGKFYPYEKGIVGVESEYERIKREQKVPLAEYQLLNPEYSGAGYRPLMHLQRKDTILWFWHNGEDIVITDESFSGSSNNNTDAYTVLKKAYEKIDFTSEFMPGEGKYNEEFLRLIRGEIPYVDPQSREKLTYYYYDADGDGVSELGISDEVNYIYLFDYDEEQKRITLWKDLSSTWYRLMGTQKIYWNNGGTNIFYSGVNQEGEEVEARFYSDEIFNEDTKEAEIIYMVAYPKGIDQTALEEIKSQAYYENQAYYFRVTQEQYDELTNRYFMAETESREKSKEVGYSYQEIQELLQVKQEKDYSGSETYPYEVEQKTFSFSVDQGKEYHIPYVRVSGLQDKELQWKINHTLWENACWVLDCAEPGDHLYSIFKDSIYMQITGVYKCANYLSVVYEGPSERGIEGHIAYAIVVDMLTGERVLMSDMVEAPSALKELLLHYFDGDNRIMRLFITEEVADKIIFYGSLTEKETVQNNVQREDGEVDSVSWLFENASFYMTEEAFVILPGARCFEPLYFPWEEVEGVIAPIAYSAPSQARLEEIVAGNYQCVNDVQIKGQLEHIFQTFPEDVMWIYQDLNGDGQEDLILQEKASDTGYARIIGIFAIVNDKVSVILWDDNDMTHFYELCNEGVLSYSQYYGIYENERFERYQFDSEWNKVFVAGMEQYRIEEAEEYEPVQINGNITMEKEGLYCWYYYEQDEERQYMRLTPLQWEEEFLSLFGKSYTLTYDGKPPIHWQNSALLEESKQAALEQYLLENIPELFDYADYIQENSDGAARMYIEICEIAEVTIGESKDRKRRYPIYVGEKWDDHNANWEWFYVDENLNEVYWHDIVEGEFYTLEEWRKGDKYRNFIDS